MRRVVALIGTALVALAHAQPLPPATEAQARYWVYGAFLTHAVPEIMSERVALGPELEQQLGIASGADRAKVYDALMNLIDGRALRVRKATADEVAKYAPRAKRELKDPLFAIQAGELTLLVQYDLQANVIPFVGQLSAPPQPAPAARSAPAVAPEKPPAAAVAATAPRVEPQPEPLKPTGPCVVKPVMSEQDLANCRAGARAIDKPQPAPPPVRAAPPPVMVQPPVRAAPPPPESAPSGPCVVKPVMSEEDLANCRASARIGPPPSLPAPVVTRVPERAVAPAPERKASPCVVKPVMSEEDLLNCGVRSR